MKIQYLSEFSRLFNIASDHTTRNYLDYLKKAFLIGEVKNTLRNLQSGWSIQKYIQ